MCQVVCTWQGYWSFLSTCEASWVLFLFSHSLLLCVLIHPCPLWASVSPSGQ